MRLNDLKPAGGSKLAGKRPGRGHAAGQGKTCGRGQKGQHARSGGYTKIGFEGGQMPLQRRLPKVGFRSHLSYRTAEVRLHELSLPEADVIDLDVLKKSRLIPAAAQRAKVILSGTLDKAVTLKGIAVSKGAKSAIEKAGGKIED